MLSKRCVVWRRGCRKKKKKEEKKAAIDWVMESVDAVWGGRQDVLKVFFLTCYSNEASPKRRETFTDEPSLV